MKRRKLMRMTTVVPLLLLLFAGCGEEQKSESIPTEPPVATVTEVPVEEPTVEPTVTIAPTEAPTPTAEPTAPVPTESIPEPTPELTATPEPTATPKPTVKEHVKGLDLPELWKQELLHALELGMPMEKVQQVTISGVEMAELLDYFVEYANPGKLAEWKELLPKLRTHEDALTRFDAMGALFLAARTVGGNWAEFQGNYTLVFDTLQFPWNDYYFTEGLFGEHDAPLYTVPGLGDSNYLDGACLPFNLSRQSPFSGEFPFAYDAEANSIHEYDQPTYAEGLLAVVRMIASADLVTSISVDDLAATTPDSSILTPELLAKAQANPDVTSEDHPRWTGLTLGYAYEYQFDTSVRELELTAEWGFNSARLALHYLTLFSEDAQMVNLESLRQLDRLVAAAIENDLHFNICLFSVPGRSVLAKVYDYNYTGDFDLFINPEKQEQAFDVYRVLAARYKDVPNFNLSIQPFWEPLNKDFSTGLPAPEYGPEDVAVFLGKAIDVIRTEDPDRLITYEPTSNNPYTQIIEESTPIKTVADSRGNVIINYNFCEGAYVYACMTMEEGEHIDNMNNSMYVPEYPNYIYSVASSIYVGSPDILDGFLPGGTTVDLYLERSYGGTLDISADGTSLYNETLPTAEYTVGERLSGHYPFAVSDKHISVTLTDNVDKLIFSCLGDGGYELCGIKLTLPEEYAVERWYYVQGYDVFQGVEQETGIVKRSSSEVLISPKDPNCGRQITIHDDLNYTSELVIDEASEETINTWSEAINDFDANCVIRFERADFSGTTWDSMAAYYEDLLKSFEKYGFSWWSNDWWLLTGDRDVIAECPYTEYAGYESFNLELLRLLQKYQSTDRP